MKKFFTGSLCLECVNFHKKYFSLKGGIQKFFKADRNKLFASNEKQIDNHTSMLDMLHSYMSVLCVYHCIGVSKRIFCGVAVVLC